MSSCCGKISKIFVVLSLLSIIGSIGIWYLNKGTTPESIAHAERFGLFVGLWAPTFMGFANYFRGCGESSSKEMIKKSCCQSH